MMVHHRKRAHITLIVIRSKSRPLCDFDHLFFKKQPTVDRPYLKDSRIGVAETSGPALSLGNIDAQIEAFRFPSGDTVGEDNGGA